MTEYWFQERAKVFGKTWSTVRVITNPDEAEEYWLALPKGNGVDQRMLRRQILEDAVHYHNGEGDTWW